MSTVPLTVAQSGPALESRAAGSGLPKEDLAAARSPETAEVDTGARPRPGLRSLTNRETEKLLARGHQLLEIGDIASARLLFQLLVEAGDPRGAKAMGMTFDPKVLAELRVTGMPYDHTQAQMWYERADAMVMGTRSPDRVVDPADGRRGQE
jgi:hypothetical protein